VIEVTIEGDAGHAAENDVAEGFASAGAALRSLPADAITNGAPPALSFEPGELVLNDSPFPAGSASPVETERLDAPIPPGSNGAASPHESRLAPPVDGDLSTLPFNAQALEIEAWGAPDRSAQAREREAARAENIQAEQSVGAPTADGFLRSFAKGAGVPEQIFARQDALRVAEDLGALMRLSVENLTQLLSARFKAKRFARTSSQTMIQALDNNPLKFAPTSDDALKIMFGPRTSGYLEAKRAFEGAFKDLKTHQVNTFAAMQQAVRMLVEDLDPQALEEAAGPEGRLAGLLGSRKRRLWDLYLARWQAKTLRHQDGLVDAFMLYFAECYDEAKDPNAKS
jgi:type VI secretion system protein ImpI